MGLDLYGVHRFDLKEGPNGPVAIQTGHSPYARFVQDGETPVICQSGYYYSDGGDKIKKDDVPSWVWRAAENMTVEALENYGIKLPSKKSYAEEPAPDDAVNP